MCKLRGAGRIARVGEQGVATTVGWFEDSFVCHFVNRFLPFFGLGLGLDDGLRFVFRGLELLRDCVASAAGESGHVALNKGVWEGDCHVHVFVNVFAGECRYLLYVYGDVDQS